MRMERTTKQEQITKRDARLWEQYEETFFAALMADLADELGDQALRDQEALLADPQAALPPELLRRCSNTIQTQFRRQRVRTTTAAVRRKTRPLLRYAAAAIAVISILFTSAVAAMPELRRDMLNFVVQVYEDSTTYSLSGLRPPTPIHEIKAGWLPDGYGLADERTTPMSRTNLYQTDDGKEIEIYVADMSGAGISVDTEDTVVTDIELNGHTVTTIFKKGLDGYGEPYERSVVVWIDQVHSWYIEVSSHDESIETMLQVSEAVTVR